MSSTDSSSSPAAQYALKFIKAAYHGYRPDGPWIKLRLEPGDYLWLEDQIKSDTDLWGWVSHKFRFDYNPHSCVLIFRKPSATHECFIHKVEFEIQLQLNQLSTNMSKPETASLASSIASCRCADIVFYRDRTDKKEYPMRSPDSSFIHRDVRYPALVIEVSYPQKRKDLPYLADSYILSSHGHVRMVIGLDIEHPQSQEATVSVWQPYEGFELDGTPYLAAQEVVKYDPFRNSDSSPVSTDSALTIPMSVFLPYTRTFNPLLPDILIPYTTLCTFLHEAEMQQQVLEVIPLAPGTQLRQQHPRSEEELNEAEEARIAVREADAIRETYKADSV